MAASLGGSVILELLWINALSMYTQVLTVCSVLSNTCDAEVSPLQALVRSSGYSRACDKLPRDHRQQGIDVGAIVKADVNSR